MAAIRLTLVVLIVLIGLVATAPLFVILAVSAGFAHAVRWLDRRLQARIPRGITGRDVYRFDGTLGFKMRPNLDCYCPSYTADMFHLKTCADGWPGWLTVEESDVVVIGDSYAAGVGVDAERSYFGRWGKIKIKPIACPGYDMVQGLLAAQSLPAGALEGKLVVWLVCLENDLFENRWPSMRTRSKPFLVETAEGSWRIDAHHLQSGEEHAFTAAQGRFRSVKATLGAITSYYRASPLAARGYPAAVHLLGEMSDVVKRAGGRLAVVTIPPRDIFLPRRLLDWVLKRYRIANPESLDLDYPDKQFGPACDALGISYTSGRQIFGFWDYLVLGDEHWNERGHRKMQKLVRELYRSS
ncbi:hypothetical protein BH11MYX1_BH11MYX1_07550 [soil metagenome]